MVAISVVKLMVPEVSVPTLVKLELTTLDASVVPVKVSAFAVTVISTLPSNATPLIVFEAANLVAVAAFPVVEPELPVILPVIGAVTVKLAKVPTLVKLEPVTVDFNVVPVNVSAAAGAVISALPSKATPLIVFAVANLVAVAALPVIVV